MKRILILDTETDGVDASVNSIVEVGSILFDLEHACAIECWSSLVRCESNAAHEVNRIPEKALAELEPELYGLERIIDGLRSAVVMVEAIVAYRSEFDRAFVERANDGPFVNGLGDKVPWVCAMQDIQWPRSSGSKALTSVALAHDLGVGHAHRALVDCDLIARLFARSAELGQDLQAMMARAMRPKGKVVADVSYEDRDKAKQAGFTWDNTKKEWWKVMALDDVAALPFRSHEVTA